jgi:hypothetical protein
MTILRVLPDLQYNVETQYEVWAAHEGWWIAGQHETCEEGCAIDAGHPIYLTGVVGETYCVEHAPQISKSRILCSQKVEP